MLSLQRNILLIIFCCLIVITSRAQCPSGNTPQTLTASCGQSCFNLSFTIPDIRETSDYIAVDLDYNPFLFENRSLPAVSFASPPQWPGNSYSPVVDLPFTFCFFDSLYNHLVIGSNGCVSFDTTMALKWCEPRQYVNTSPRTLPSAFFAKALIAGVMQDLDPFDTTRSVTGEKVEFHVEGSAPCRVAIINYYKVPLWPGPAGGCQSSVNTYQIVLHEGTGVIDVYEKDKPPCSGSNNGNAILGIQNWDRDHAVAPRFRNGFNWGGNNINEAFRFVPSGGNTRFITCDLYENGTIFKGATTTTTPAGLGLMTVQFPNICTNSSTNFYVMHTTYSSCTGTGLVVLVDTVYVTHSTTLENLDYDVVFASCGGANGTITVHVPTGAGRPPYLYSISGGPLQPDSVFTGLAAGNYLIHVQDNGGCSKDSVIRMRAANQLFVTYTVDTPSCNLARDGQITVTVLNGNPAFQYSLNGAPFQPRNIFTNLSPGNYTVDVQDVTGCKSLTQNITVPPGPPLDVLFQTTATSCAGINNGTIILSPGNGSAPYQFSLNGGPPQASNTFTGLAANSYTVHISDGSGCTADVTPTVPQGQPLSPSAVKTDVSCNGGSDGSITVSLNSGVAPFSYSLDNTNFQSSNIFSGLAAGSYTIYVKDNNACGGTTTITLSQPQPLVSTTNITPVKCNGDANGVIDITGSGGTSPYQYSIDGVNYQPLTTFTVAAGNYTVYVRDSKNCIATKGVTVSQPQLLTFTYTTQNASCGGGNDGHINISAVGGNSGYSYSTDGTNFQSSNVLNVAPGTYTAYVKDANGCQASVANIAVGLSNTLAIRAIVDTSICKGKSVSLNAVSNATQFTWTPVTGLSNASIANPTATPTSTTTYIVNASFGPCLGSDTVTVNVLPLPIANAGTAGNICQGDSIQLAGSGGINYLWTPSSGLTNAAIPNPFARPSQTTAYHLSVTDANGCTSSNTADVTVTIIPPPRVNITPDTYASPGETIQLHAEGGTRYTWTPPTGLNNPSIGDPVATIATDITYRVVVLTAEGCKATDSVTIKAFKGPDIYMSTAFTPNHDGKNDKFTPFPVGIKEITYFTVYNRWGQVVFETHRLHEGWDGRVAGLDQDTGVYVWIVRGVTNDGKVIFKKGTVTLIH
jgi:gliding motility-associated-like protein